MKARKHYIRSHIVNIVPSTTTIRTIIYFIITFLNLVGSIRSHIRTEYNITSVLELLIIAVCRYLLYIFIAGSFFCHQSDKFTAPPIIWHTAATGCIMPHRFIEQSPELTRSSSTSHQLPLLAPTFLSTVTVVMGSSRHQPLFSHGSRICSYYHTYTHTHYDDMSLIPRVL